MKNLDKAYEILEPFVDYCLSFYGEDGLYDMGATKDQVTAATLHHLHTTEHEFMGDSFDREAVRAKLEYCFGLCELPQDFAA